MQTDEYISIDKRDREWNEEKKGEECKTSGRMQKQEQNEGMKRAVLSIWFYSPA